MSAWFSWRACVCLLLLAAPRSPAAGADGGVFEEEIEVKAHYDNAVGTSDAASEGRISRQLVEDRPLLRAGEVLELVPGLIVTQHSGAGKANQYFLRGFNLDHGTDFATTVDGMPVNLRSHAHGQGYTDLNFLIPELIQVVDYYKGPYFAAKGDFASAGAADIHYATSLPKSVIALTGGSNLYGRALFAGSPAVAEGHLLYAVEAFHDDGPWEKPDDYRRFNGVLRYTRALGETTLGVTAMGYFGIWNATDQIPRRAVDAGEISRFGSLDPTDGGKSSRFSLSADYDRALGAGVFKATVYAVRYRLDLFSDFTYFLDDPVHGDQFEQTDNRDLFGTSGRWDAVATAGPLPLRLAAGWEARHDRVDPAALRRTQARARLTTVREDFVRETSGALFAEAEAAFTRWLRTIGGVRYDHYFFDVSSDNAANSGRDDAGRLSPKLSIIAGPWASTELFANYGLGFHSNDARGVVTRIDPASGQPVSGVTPLVATRGGELGVRTQLVPSLETSLSLWRLDLDSELIFTGDAGTTEPSRASRRQGIELSSRFRALRWLLFDFDAAVSRARFTSPGAGGDHIPGAIDTVVSAAATIQKLGPWSASAHLRYFGPRPLVEDDSVRSTASAIVDAQGSYTLAKWAHLSLDVFNLFDAHVDDISYLYVSRLRGEPAGGVNDVHFHPSERRSVRLTASIAY